MTAGAELARLYDLDMVDHSADVELILALARAGRGPILELACGSGRICLPLARAGHDVVGVDRDPEMLARARRSWAVDSDQGRLELVDGDITRLDLGRRFGLVILALNSLLMLPGREAQLAALQVITRHLAPEGRALIDVVLPSAEDLSAYDGRLEVAWLRRDDEGQQMVAKMWSAQYQPAAAMASVTTLFDCWPLDGGPLRRISRSDEMHLLGAHELIALAERAGLQPETVAGDHEMGAFGPDSSRIVLVAALL
ncbi:MAG TPA: class I SAM-dependent methyltransferase [Candidatus Limnocylindrales bacterium]|nr:class I SAM-dependent methyltransferase [Candidatus Limnocylindrales bacterium]